MLLVTFKELLLFQEYLSELRLIIDLLYISEKSIFFVAWGIVHSTGILHSSTGQAAFDHACGTLKCQLQKQKGAMQEQAP